MAQDQSNWRNTVEVLHLYTSLNGAERTDDDDDDDGDGTVKGSPLDV